MNIGIVLKTERGEVIASSDALLLVGPQFSRLRRRVPTLQHVHPAALTMFNLIERANLMSEIAAADPGLPADDAVLAEIVRLCEVALDEAHLYLWFLGA